MKRKIFYYLLTVIFTVTLLQAPVYASSDLEEKVVFTDENIKKEIINSLTISENLFDSSKVLEKDKVDGYEPTVGDMENLKKLKIGALFDEDLNVITASSLKGLEKASNLEYLHLSSLHCSDLSAIENLENLKELYISYNDLENIDFIKNFTELEVLNLNSNEINNLNGIDKLSKLKTLTLSENNIDDITLLSNLESLECLYLVDNNISNIKPLNTLVKLKELTLSGNKIKDISALETLVNLEKLYINGEYTGPYEDPNPNGNAVSDISALKNLIKLKDLQLQDLVYIKDLTPIKDLTNLKSLILRGNSIEDISPLENLTNLEVLYLYKNNLTNISALNNMTNMKELNLSVNKIKDISALENMHKLEDLKVYSNEITDLSPVKDCKAFTMNFSDNKVIDISVFKDLAKSEDIGYMVLENQSVEDEAKLIDSTENEESIEFIIENPLNLIDGEKFKINANEPVNKEDYEDFAIDGFLDKYNKSVEFLNAQNIKIKSIENNISITIPKSIIKDKMDLQVPYMSIGLISGESSENEVYGQAGGILNLALNTSNKNPNNNTEEIRFDGKNRIETAVKISKENYKQADAVILVNSIKEVDALSASPLASKENSPILLINEDNIPKIVEEEIERLGAKKIFLIGGKNSISNSVIENIKLETERINGLDRFETAIKIAEKTGMTENIILANGYSLIDALASSSLAIKEDRSIILVKKNEIPKSAEKIINEAKDILIVGGKNSVDLELKAERLDGSNRYETAIKVAKRAYPNPKSIALSNADAFADSLVFGPVTEKLESPILLTEKSNLRKETKEYLNKEKIEKIYILGGTDSIENDILK